MKSILFALLIIGLVVVNAQNKTCANNPLIENVTNFLNNVKLPNNTNISISSFISTIDELKKNTAQPANLTKCTQFSNNSCCTVALEEKLIQIALLVFQQQKNSQPPFAAIIRLIEQVNGACGASINVSTTAPANKTRFLQNPPPPQNGTSGNNTTKPANGTNATMQGGNATRPAGNATQPAGNTTRPAGNATMGTNASSGGQATVGKTKGQQGQESLQAKQLKTYEEPYNKFRAECIRETVKFNRGNLCALCAPPEQFDNIFKNGRIVLNKESFDTYQAAIGECMDKLAAIEDSYIAEIEKILDTLESNTSDQCSTAVFKLRQVLTKSRSCQQGNSQGTQGGNQTTPANSTVKVNQTAPPPTTNTTGIPPQNSTNQTRPANQTQVNQTSSGSQGNVSKGTKVQPRDSTQRKAACSSQCQSSASALGPQCESTTPGGVNGTNPDASIKLRILEVVSGTVETSSTGGLKTYIADPSTDSTIAVNGVTADQQVDTSASKYSSSQIITLSIALMAFVFAMII